ncbi:hypothetical protein HLB35_09990 [Halomonas sp. TBZ9]|uniref:Uncharacterized protein n=1 Tax=Vreelandella azerica TaxID=2732867 RepID=A0A7Y3TYB3_9GAMM|nr:hypothetical protein [Halomonas azerica]NOG32005.1 hypothetical protein [Halomonas azerica]
MSIFDDLYTSLREAVETQQGKAQVSRITRHELVDRPARKIWLTLGIKKQYGEAGIKRG